MGPRLTLEVVIDGSVAEARISLGLLVVLDLLVSLLCMLLRDSDELEVMVYVLCVCWQEIKRTTQSQPIFSCSECCQVSICVWQGMDNSLRQSKLLVYDKLMDCG